MYIYIYIICYFKINVGVRLEVEKNFVSLDIIIV